MNERGLFVGREEELAFLERALTEARGGRGAVLLLVGEAGIGKTRLAEEVAAGAEAAGMLVGWGRSWEGPGTPAYWPWVQLFRRLLADGAAARHVEAAAAASPALAALLDGGAVEEGGDPEQARFRLFDAVGRLLARVGAERPLVLVLDDLHAADLSTLLLLHFVARDLRGRGVVVLGTTRDPAVHAAAEAAALLGRIAREATQLSLPRLGREALARWVAEAAPTLAGGVDRVWATSEGNPLFVAELLTAARRLPEPRAQEMPLGIREALRAHLALLSPAAATTLEAAAVLGRDLAQADLTALVGAEAAGAAVEEARRLQIMMDLGAGRLRFAHVLLRDELAARLAPARRLALHREAAALCLRAHAPFAAAHHALLGAGDDAVGAALSAVQSAQREGMTHLAFEDAAALGARALAELGPRLTPAQVAALHTEIAEAALLAGDPPRARSHAATAAAIAGDLGDPALLGRAALLVAGEPGFFVDESLIALLRRAVAAQPEGDAPLRAELLARLAAAMAPALPRDGDEFLRIRQESLGMARRLGHDETLFVVLRHAAFDADAVPVRERFAGHAETINLAERLGRVPRIAAVFARQAGSWLELGDSDGARGELERAARLLAPYSQPHYRFRVPLLRAVLDELAGRFAEADAAMREVLEIADRDGLDEAVRLVSVCYGSRAYIRGEHQVLEPFESRWRAVLAPMPLSHIWSSLFDAPAGHRERARAALSQVPSLPVQVMPGVTGLAFACAEAELEELAPFFYDLACRARHRLQIGPETAAVIGPTALVRGRLATLLGRWDEATRHLDEAMAVVTELQSPPLVAQTHLARAVLEARRGRPPREHAARALELAQSLGMGRVAARAAELGGAGLVSTASAPTAPSPAAPAPLPSLTLAREGELWVLAAGSRRLLLKDGKGAAYLAALVERPHHELHVLELVGGEDDGDAGPLLDARAKQAYRARAAELEQELAEANRHHDPGRIERLRAELEALGDELARAVGLGGRDRRAGSAAERARINVQRRLRDLVRRVSAEDELLGRHLELSVRTGTFCMYAPSWPSGA